MGLDANTYSEISSDKFNQHRFYSKLHLYLVPDLKKRWKHFRDHYQKKLRAENAGLKSLHTWEYKSHLSFLTEFSNQKDKTREDSDHDEPQNQEEVFMPDSDIPVQSVLNDQDVLDIDEANTEIEQVDTIPKKKRKKMDTLATVLENRLAERFRFDTSKSAKSPIHKFFESMADIVAEFPPHLAAETRLKVCQIVNEIEMKKHSEQQYI